MPVCVASARRRSQGLDRTDTFLAYEDTVVKSEPASIFNSRRRASQVSVLPICYLLRTAYLWSSNPVLAVWVLYPSEVRG